jgi:hypothetical protein
MMIPLRWREYIIAPKRVLAHDRHARSSAYACGGPLISDRSDYATLI